MADRKGGGELEPKTDVVVGKGDAVYAKDTFSLWETKFKRTGLAQTTWGRAAEDPGLFKQQRAAEGSASSWMKKTTTVWSIAPPFFLLERMPVSPGFSFRMGGQGGSRRE